QDAGRAASGVWRPWAEPEQRRVSTSLGRRRRLDLRWTAPQAPRGATGGTPRNDPRATQHEVVKVDPMEHFCGSVVLPVLEAGF
ncbi:MAG: hypothetical protein ACREYF_22765, partial [Gammaproteobacteria bacterium]